MTSNLKSKVLANFCKRVGSTNAPGRARLSLLSETFRRASHSSVYEKNVEVEEPTNLAPTTSVGSQETDGYWAPHPQTGVFVPEAEVDENAGENENLASPSYVDITGEDSVLDEKVFDRSTGIQDSEKPIEL